MNLQLPIDVLAVLHQLQQSGFEAYIVGGAVRDIFLLKQIPTDWDFTTNATPTQIQSLFPESFYENDFGTVGISRQHIREQFDLPELNSTQDDEKTAYNQVINADEATKIHESLIPESKQHPLDTRSSRFARNLPDDTSDLKSISVVSKHLFEITTFRSDGKYTDFRRPESVTWGQTLEEDLYRRDFTINAMAIHIEQPDKYLKKTEDQISIAEHDVLLIDPHTGLQDLQRNSIKTVGDPALRFEEDALRMLRAIRISVQLGFTIEQHTLNAIKKQSSLIDHVSWERIRDEFLKILSSSTPLAGINLLDDTGLLQHILPELIEMKGVEQGGHHTTDVWTHSLDALASCPSPDPIVRFATLLHDISKPQTFRRTEKTITFYNHELIGARVAKKIAERFKLSKQDTQRMFILVRHHMFHYQPTMSDAAIRRFMRKVGLENINDILDLRIGDRLGSGARETSWRLEEMKARMQDQLHQPFEIKDLAINGNDLITDLHLQPGRIIGDVLKHLFEIVMENPDKNTKEELIKEVQQYLSEQKN